MLPPTYLVRIIQVHNPAPTRADILMTLPLPTHRKGRIHMHIMTRKVQTDEALEHHTIGRLGRRQKDQQARGCAAIGDHVKDCSEAGGLPEFSRGPAIEGVEEAGDGVQEATAAWVEGHEVEGC